MQKLSQLPDLDQLLQIVTQSSTIFYSVSTILMTLVIKTLITPHGVTFHFIWPFEVWFNLYLLKNLMHRLLEYCADHLGSRYPMSSKISPGSIVIIPLRAKFSSFRGSHFCLPFPLLLIILSLFMFINLIH